MGVMNVWFFKRASDAEKDQPMYYFRMVEPDFSPLPIYGALKEEAHRRPVMYPGYHQEDHWAVSYQGDWRQIADSGAVLGGYRESRNTGDNIELLFSGTDLSLVLAEGSEGTLSASCGDEPPLTKAINKVSSGESQPIAVCGGMDDSVHEVSIQVLSAEGGNSTIRADGFIVRRDPS